MSLELRLNGMIWGRRPHVHRRRAAEASKWWGAGTLRTLQSPGSGASSSTPCATAPTKGRQHSYRKPVLLPNEPLLGPDKCPRLSPLRGPGRRPTVTAGKGITNTKRGAMKRQIKLFRFSVSGNWIFPRGTLGEVAVRRRCHTLSFTLERGGLAGG